jgi:LPS-assembly lipoprotein
MMLIMLPGIKTRLAPPAPCRRYPCSALLLVFVLACGAGCGFRLASPASGAGAVGTIYLETPQPNSEFGSSLRDALRIRGVSVATTREEARMVVRILEDTTGQRILSVSARNVPREYEVFYLVSFVIELDQQPTPAAEQLIAVRNYTFDETERLGKSAEEEALRRTLAAELTVRMIRRIETTAGGEPGAIVLLPPTGS